MPPACTRGDRSPERSSSVSGSCTWLAPPGPSIVVGTEKAPWQCGGAGPLDPNSRQAWIPAAGSTSSQQRGQRTLNST
jgi:hypothetical protein